MKKNLQLVFTIFTIILGLNATAQNEVYWREGFEPSATPACDLSTTKPTTFSPAYFNGNSGSWYCGGVYRTTGTGCPAGNNHVRFSNFNTAGPDSNFLVTPVVDFGIQEFHFLRARANRTYTLWITTDTAATTTNWTQPTTLKGWANTTCTDTTVVLANANAKRLKIVTKFGIDVDLDSIYLTSVNHILPVKFGSVSATALDKLVKLNFNIETEVNISSYDIERSINGDKYVAIGSIKANNAKSYNYIDNTPAEVNYYRVKAYDRNGKTVYSTVVKVASNTKGASLNVYPNPSFGKTVNVQLNGISKGDYKVNIYSVAGTLVNTQTVSSNGSSLAKTIDLPILSNGFYTVEVSSTNGTKLTKTIIVQ